MCYLSHIESNKMLYNQQQQRFESAQNFQQRQPYNMNCQQPMQYSQSQAETYNQMYPPL